MLIISISYGFKILFPSESEQHPIDWKNVLDWMLITDWVENLGWSNAHFTNDFSSFRYNITIFLNSVWVSERNDHQEYQAV